MIFPEVPENDADRVRNLKEYSILDTLPEKEYDNITFLASFICETPIALVTLIDDKRQWFKSKVGIDGDGTSRETSFCGHAINQDDILIIPDSRVDARFTNNPYVLGDPNVVFYAGVPLVSSEGFALGTLCIVDQKPRKLSEKQKNGLKALANQVVALLDKRKQSYDLERLNSELHGKNEILENFASVIAHDLKSPLSSIILNSSLMKEGYSTELDERGINLLTRINKSSHILSELIDGILEYSKNGSILGMKKEVFHLDELMGDLEDNLLKQKDVEINYTFSGERSLFENKTAIKQILLNLVSNSIKYNDKDTAVINIEFEQDKDFYKIKISDNGPGISDYEPDKAFNMFETFGKKDKYGHQGTGIGLATVKNLVHALGGEIEVESNNGLHTILTFSKYKDELSLERVRGI